MQSTMLFFSRDREYFADRVRLEMPQKQSPQISSLMCRTQPRSRLRAQYGWDAAQKSAPPALPSNIRDAGARPTKRLQIRRQYGARRLPDAIPKGAIRRS